LKKRRLRAAAFPAVFFWADYIRCVPKLQDKLKPEPGLPSVSFLILTGIMLLIMMMLVGDATTIVDIN